MVVLYAARHQLRVPALARWLLALGIVATLAANVAHGWSHGPIGAAVAAWPAASLVGSYELLLWLIRSAAGGSVVREPAPDQPGGPADQPGGPADQPVGPADQPVGPADQPVGRADQPSAELRLVPELDQESPEHQDSPGDIAARSALGTCS